MARGPLRYNAPPTWPPPPPGWTPPREWAPDPAWPAPPAGWEFWLPIEGHPGWAAPASPRSIVVRVIVATVFVSVLIFAASLGVATYLVILGLVAVPVGFVATIGDRSRPWLVNRKLGVAVLVLGLVCLVIAGAIAGPARAFWQ